MSRTGPRPSVFVEAASADDVEALVRVERRCFSHPWTPQNFRDAIGARAYARVLVVRAPHDAADPERGLIAYCVYQAVAGELHVHNIAVHPGHRGRGLGRWLMELTMAVAARAGARTALLEVRRSNEEAQRLYRSLGFRTVATRRDYYRQPTEDALVLECALGSADH